MGGYGSGRPGGKRKAEHLRSLDVNRLHKAGHLRPGNFGGWQWTQNGKEIASIGTRGEVGRVVLVYRVSPHDKPPKDVKEPIWIHWQPCHFGGARPFFYCPGVVNGRDCGRKVGKLFQSGTYFLCRHCHRVAYASQSELPGDRAIRAANKRRKAMGGEPGVGNYVPKPKGMHWATYWRHVSLIERADEEANLDLIRLVQRRFPGVLPDFDL